MSPLAVLLFMMRQTWAGLECLLRFLSGRKNFRTSILMNDQF